MNYCHFVDDANDDDVRMVLIAERTCPHPYASERGKTIRVMLIVHSVYKT